MVEKPLRNQSIHVTSSCYCIHTYVCLLVNYCVIIVSSVQILCGYHQNRQLQYGWDYRAAPYDFIIILLLWKYACLRTNIICPKEGVAELWAICMTTEEQTIYQLGNSCCYYYWMTTFITCSTHLQM